MKKYELIQPSEFKQEPFYPEESEWSCCLFGSTPDDGIFWRPKKGDEPNCFWRLMQYLILGNKWVKRK